MDKATRAAWLRNEVNKHDKAYYVDAKPTITDQAYDQLYLELVEIEKDNPSLALPDSPTQRVGNELKGGFVTVTHRLPMLSLDKTYDEGEVRRFDERVQALKGMAGGNVEYTCETKIDGAAVSLIYKDGYLFMALTRGDGDKGEDITNNIKTVKQIPLRLDEQGPPKLVEIRGEVYMPRKEFERINKAREQDGESPFANPRNAAAGSMKLLDPKEVAKRGLRFFAHTLGYAEGYAPKSHAEFFRDVNAWGLATPPCQHEAGMDGVWAWIKAWQTKRKDLDYDTDGIVVKVNRYDVQKAIGFSAKAPKYAMAFKYKAEEQETVVLDIKVQVGKSGVLTPVAVFKPVHISGSVVTYASLHNQDEIERKDVRIGDHVMVEKAGEIIPQVVRVVESKRTGDERKFRMPLDCPVCGTPVFKSDTEVAIRCPNEDCPGRVGAQILYFCSRQCMDIEDIGEKLVEGLTQEGLVKTVADLYSLTVSDLMTLDRMGEKTAEKLVERISSSCKNDLSKLLCALNIPGIGEASSEAMAEHFLDLESILRSNVASFLEVKGFGEKTAKNVFQFFSSPKQVGIIQRLMDAGVNTKSHIGIARKAVISKGGFMVGKSFVVTGTLTKFGRDEAEKAIKDNGGKVSSSVSKKTDFLLVGDSPGSKLAKAKSLGVRVIGEEDFEKLLKGEKI